jgi:branched-chain amino acid transport system permease protein
MKARLSLDDMLLLAVVCMVAIFSITQHISDIPIYYLKFLSNVIIFGIFALAYNLLHGHTGLISFGHAGFFLVGAYGGALGMLYVAKDAWLGLLCCLFCSASFAFLVGFTAVRIRGIYFSLLTLAFSMLPYLLVRTSLRRLTGGHMGIQFIAPPAFFFDLSDLRLFLYFALGALVATYLILRAILDSSYGDCLRCVRDNETKLEGLGYNTRRIKYIAVTISGTLSGFAGYLFLLNSLAISPAIGFYFGSAKVIFVALIGGVSSITGPILGTFFWYLVEEFLVQPGFVEIILGAALIIVILRFPSGFIALIQGRT